MQDYEVYQDYLSIKYNLIEVMPSIIEEIESEPFKKVIFDMLKLRITKRDILKTVKREALKTKTI